MPTWSGILDELKSLLAQGDRFAFDRVRRKYIVAIHQHTGRNVILYASKWTQGETTSPEAVSINEEDLQGLMEVVHGLQGDDLDLILHSPGGSPVAVEALVTYLRSKFSDIRVIVPQAAMSAATMLACAADRIVLGKHSFLGPTDPQIVLQTSLGVRMVPAHAILNQFSRALKECQDPKNLGAWLPMLPQYGPDLLEVCRNVCRLSEELVDGWLRQYMFRAERSRQRKAKSIAKWLSAHQQHKLHGRHLSREQLEKRGLLIDHLEDDQAAQDGFLSVFHATTHTFSATAAVKIIENQLGKAFIKQVGVMQVTAPVLVQPQPPLQPPAGTVEPEGTGARHG